VLAGRLLDRVERGERAFGQVVLEVLVRELRVGIDPRDTNTVMPSPTAQR
jgi:hypothetical protein